MSRNLFVQLCCCFFIFTLHAQGKEYIYKDSALQKEVQPGDSLVWKVETKKVPGEDTEALSNENNSTPDTVLHYQARPISPDTITSWKHAKEFFYTTYLDSLLKDMQQKERAKPKKKNYEGTSIMDRFFSSTVTKTIFYILAGFFILFFIYRLFLTEGFFKSPTQKSKPVVPQVIEEEISAKSDFEGMIREALRTDNFRLAVRYHYVRTLHLLASKGIIHFSLDKTNYQYVSEINNNNQQNDFSRLTLHYEYVWYGDFAINKTIYQKIENEFLGFNKKL